MAYLVLAYPELDETSFDLIQTYRKNNDELYYSVVQPHFTIVFPVFNKTEAAFKAEIDRIVQSSSGFGFSLRCAVISKDAFSDYYHAFLVPDEGHSQFVKLHDKLYSGNLKDNLRLDVDFIPHLGIGNSKDKFTCKRMVDEWNEKDFDIKGTISELTIVNYENDIVEIIEKIELI